MKQGFLKRFTNRRESIFVLELHGKKLVMHPAAVDGFFDVLTKPQIPNDYLRF